MIVQSSNELRQQLQEYGRLKQNESQLASIQNTANELAGVQRQIKAWVEIYPLLLTYFSEQERYDLSRQATEIQRRLSECKERFQNTNRYPKELLQQLQRLSAKVTESTAEAWRRYAENCLTPLQEMVHTAQQLPKMQTKLAQIKESLSTLVNQSKKLPKRLTEIQHFHNQLNEIKRQLQAVETINDQQRAFLAKVQQGTATVADLDEALLQWCKQQGLAMQLKLTSKV